MFIFLTVDFRNRWSGEPEFFLTLILHHGGKFLRDDKNVLEYVGGEIDVWEGLDVDTMCLWTPFDLCKEHGYVRFDSIWWHNPDFNLEKGLRPLAEGLDVRQMCNIGMVRDWEITVDDILRMTMAPDFVEDDASEDTEVVLQIADQGQVEETENEFRDSGIEVDGSAEEGAECDGAAGADLIDTNAEDIADFEGVVGADNIDTNVKKITECDGAAGVDNTVAEDEELNDAEVCCLQLSNVMMMRRRRTLFVPRRKKRVGEDVGSSSRQRRQVGGSGSDGSGGSLNGGGRGKHGCRGRRRCCCMGGTCC
ncbi:hypothetical protein SESBI_45969 [Sesbania bispinosa]|nr:hypothetical protein SESBI_45969 [Sesbania bispinosa]